MFRLATRNGSALQQLTQGAIKDLPRMSAAPSLKMSSTSQTELPSRKITVWQKRYMLLAFKHKSVADIPDVMTIPAINLIYTRARISVNLIMAGVGLVAASIAIYLGKREAKTGQTVTKINQEWHKNFNEEHAKKEKASASSSSE